MSRPTGVTVLASLQFFYSGYGILSCLALLLVAPFRDSLLQAAMQIIENDPNLQESGLSIEMMQQFMQVILMVGAGVGLLLSLLGILLGFGLLKLKGWAWIGTLILQILQIIGGVQGIFSGLGSGAVSGVSVSMALFQTLLSGAIIYYLLRRDVKQAFGQ